jgi:hypothetical protein
VNVWTTCVQCAATVKGERTFYSGGYFDTYEKHECEPEPNLTVMRHITYEPVPQPEPQKVNDAVDQEE